MDAVDKNITVKRDMKAKKRQIIVPSLSFRFGEDESDEISYRLQGNQEYYTKESMKTRRFLRRHRGVHVLLSKFWSTFGRRDTLHGLMRSDFVGLYIRMMKALYLSENFNYNRALRCAKRDWQRDVGSKSGMSKEQFIDSLFELVDIWTDSLNPRIYMRFLKELYKRVTRTDFNGHLTWRSLNQVPSPNGVYEPIDKTDTVNTNARRRRLRRSSIGTASELQALRWADMRKERHLQKRKFDSRHSNPIETELQTARRKHQEQEAARMKALFGNNITVPMDMYLHTADRTELYFKGELTDTEAFELPRFTAIDDDDNGFDSFRRNRNRIQQHHHQQQHQQFELSSSTTTAPRRNNNNNNTQRTYKQHYTQQQALHHHYRYARQKKGFVSHSNTKRMNKDESTLFDAFLVNKLVAIPTHVSTLGKTTVRKPSIGYNDNIDNNMESWRQETIRHVGGELIRGRISTARTMETNILEAQKSLHAASLLSLTERRKNVDVDRTCTSAPGVRVYEPLTEGSRIRRPRTSTSYYNTREVSAMSILAKYCRNNPPQRHETDHSLKLEPSLSRPLLQPSSEFRRHLIDSNNLSPRVSTRLSLVDIVSEKTTTSSRRRRRQHRRPPLPQEHSKQTTALSYRYPELMK